METIYLYPEDLQKLMGRSQPTASRYYSFLKDVTNKKKGQKLTVFDYCTMEGVPFDWVMNRLNRKPPENFKAEKRAIN